MPNTKDQNQEHPVGCGPLTVPAQGRPGGLKLQVFECVRAAGLIARVDVARELSISAGSVTALTAELIEAGLLREATVPPREGDIVRGRPPVALCVRGEAGYVAGVKLSDYRHTAVIVDFAGNLLGQASIDSSGLQHGFSEILDAAETVLAAALKSCGKTVSGLSSVGVGLPGFIDHETGIVPWSPVVRERELPFSEALNKRLGVPVCIDNDANLVALAELWFGAGRALSNFAAITIEHGVGMGLVLDHQVYRGGRGLGMELGHIKVQLDGALCRCGQRGCLEAYVADYALGREASTALNLGHGGAVAPPVMLESLYENAKAGNEAARAIFDRAGRYLALGLANVANMLDPSLILLTGERLDYDYLYAEDVLTEMSHLTLQTGRPAPRVEIHAWGDLVWAQGAAAMALDVATQSTLSARVEAA